MPDDTAKRIEQLTRKRDEYLGTHRTLMEQYRRTNAPRDKEMASKALDEAQKVLERIKKLKALGKD